MIRDLALKLNDMEPAARTAAKWKAQTATPPVLLPGFNAPLNRMRAEVPNDSIAVVSVNDNAPTLKRIKYQHASNDDWSMRIVAGNPETAGFPYTVRRDDTVVFYTLLTVIAAGHKEWKK